MKVEARIVSFVVKWFFRIFLRVDLSQVYKLPMKGPLILVANHINAIEVPVGFCELLPRPITGFAKIESWENPLRRYLFNLWGAIPIKRGTADLGAFRKAMEALAAGKIMAIAPEGTRSYDGSLAVGNAGVIMLAARSGAPVMPMVFYGHEKFWDNVKHFRRTDFRLAFGPSFTVDKGATGKDVRQQATNEIMYQLAKLLPPEQRGLYSDLNQATTQFIKFVDN